jgi:PhzF family phenazine biosynthesis protein
MAYEVAAFTNQPSGGSPTGVVLNARGLSHDQMQHIARQLNYSHTAFVSEAHGADHDVDIRFFTPLRELQNCGHATIAAHFLRESQSQRSGNRLVRQKTASGMQTVEIRQDNRVFFKQNPIDFTDVPRETLGNLCLSLGLAFAAINERLPVMLASPGAKRFLLPVQGLETLKALWPDFAMLNSLCGRHDAIGCFVFTIENDDIHGRMFAPAIGVDEDIINGNSSGCLGAYLLRRKPALEIDFSVHQGFAFNRPGTVHVEARRNGEEIETRIGGESALVQEIPIRLG